MKEAVVKFKGRMGVKIRGQENLNKIEKRNFRKRELPEKYTAKILY